MITLDVRVPPGEGAINLRFASIMIRGRPRLLTSKRYRVFKAAVAREAEQAARVHGCFDAGEVAVSIVEYWPRVHRSTANVGLPFGDVDAPVKAILDGLTTGGLLDDDARVVEVHAKKRADPVSPRVLVGVWRL